MSDQPDPLPIPTSTKPRRPRWPWFKDEKVFGKHGPTSASSLRFLIVAVVASLIVVSWVAIVSNNASNRAVNAAREVHHEITTGHQSRLRDEAKIRAEVAANRKFAQAGNARDLACSVLQYFEQQRTKVPKKFFNFLNSRYNCTHYVPKTPFNPNAPSTSPHALGPPGGASPSPGSSHVAAGAPRTVTAPGAPGPTHTTVVIRTRPSGSPHPGPSASPTPRPSSPRPTPTRTSTTPAPPPVPVPQPVRSVVCTLTSALLGLCL